MIKSGLILLFSSFFWVISTPDAFSCCKNQTNNQAVTRVILHAGFVETQSLHGPQFSKKTYRFLNRPVNYSFSSSKGKKLANFYNDAANKFPCYHLPSVSYLHDYRCHNIIPVAVVFPSQKSAVLKSSWMNNPPNQSHRLGGWKE